jgi:5-methylcytosine-specific restriction endonuclease McrA
METDPLQLLLFGDEADAHRKVLEESQDDSDPQSESGLDPRLNSFAPSGPPPFYVKWEYSYWLTDEMERDYAADFQRMRREQHLHNQNSSEWNKHGAGRRRAERLGCEIGDRVAILEIYRRAGQLDPVSCQWCGIVISKPSHRHVDHIIPLSRGGTHSAETLCIMCTRCNLSKHDMMPQEFMRKLKVAG